MRAADLPDRQARDLAASLAGLCLLHEPDHRVVYMFNHLEYDTYTLHDDVLPRQGHPARTCRCAVQLLPRRRPGEAAEELLAPPTRLLFGNWINEMYQTTPYELERIGAAKPGMAA